MLRTRRYRVFLIFSVILGLVFLHFVRSREASSTEATSQSVPGLKTPPWDQNDGFPSSPEVVSSPGSDRINDRIQAEKPDNGPPKQPSVNKQPPSDEETDSVEPEEKPQKPAGNEAVDSEESSKTDVSVPKKPSSSNNTEQGKDSATGGQGRLGGNISSVKPKPHWQKLPEHFPVADADLIKLPSGLAKTLPKLQVAAKEETSLESLKRTQRLEAIKFEFIHSWKGYKAEALGHDEVKPVSGGFKDPFAGWGATLVDALDTLWIMGLTGEFEDAVEEVKKIDFTNTMRKDIPVFETVIRYLGGLLGAYDISGGVYSSLLDKAVELAEILMGAFDTPNRMPITYYHWQPDSVAQPHRADSSVVMAEIGSLSVEFTRLAQLTGEHKYYDAIARITDALEAMQDETRLPGLWPLKIDASGCQKSSGVSQKSSFEDAHHGTNKQKARSPPKPTPGVVGTIKNMEKRDTGLANNAEPANYDDAPPTHDTTTNPFPKKDCVQQGLTSPPGAKTDVFSLGGQADSTYEYLPKEHMLLGGLSDQYEKLYLKSMEPVRDTLLFRPMIVDDRDIRFLAKVSVSDDSSDPEKKDYSYTYEGTHLTCFAGGMFAVGAKLFDLEDDMDIAAKLTDGCVWAYESTATGIMPEAFEIMSCDDPLVCPWNETKYLDVMDPYEKDRISNAENRYQLELKEAKEKYEMLRQEELSAAKSIATQVTESSNEDPTLTNINGNIKRADITDTTTNDEEHAYVAATEAITDWTESIQPASKVEDPGFEPPPRPTVVSHKEYVERKIAEERIPRGVTRIASRAYILRPEAIESVFIMYRLTGDESWREKGWTMFQAIVRHCRTEIAASAITDVTSRAPGYSNSMESFWLAETLKYFYLLFSDPSVVSLDEYVLNTEAHPLKRPVDSGSDSYYQ